VCVVDDLNRYGPPPAKGRGAVMLGKSEAMRHGPGKYSPGPGCVRQLAFIANHFDGTSFIYVCTHMCVCWLLAF
jgi:hypothetical protein